MARLLSELTSFSRYLWTPAPWTISWINGINNTEDDVKQTSQHLSAAFGGREVRSFWNPTAGTYADLLKTANMRLGGNTKQWPEVDGLACHLRKCLQEGGHLVHLAHSQGAIVTHLAAKQLTAAEKSRIDVLTFGAAQSIDTSAGFRRVLNFYAMNDPVLYLDVNAARAWSWLDKATVAAAEASGSTHPVHRHQEARAAKELETLLHLASAARRWHACVHIQAALDTLQGQVRVPMTTIPPPEDFPADVSDDGYEPGSSLLYQVDRRQHEDAQEKLLRESRSSGCTVTFAATCTSMRNLPEAELIFCKPLSRAALDAHLLLGATYWSQIVREAQVYQVSQLQSTLVGRARLLLCGPPLPPPPPPAHIQTAFLRA